MILASGGGEEDEGTFLSSDKKTITFLAYGFGSKCKLHGDQDFPGKQKNLMEV